MAESAHKKRKHTETKQILLEVCIDNIESAIAAEQGGARRIELCSSLKEGGLTPSYGFLKIVKQTVGIQVFAMIRPRGGDFVYNSEEIEIMKEDIKILKEVGADGFVFGCLDESGRVDEKVCAELLALCGTKPATFHRAFDLTSPETRLDTLETIIKLGFTRLLTSGQHKTALLGKATLKELVNAARGRMMVMPGAGITPENVQEIVQVTGANEIHGSASKVVDSKMKAPGVSMGSSEQDDQIKVTDSEIVSRLIQNAICE